MGTDVVKDKISRGKTLRYFLIISSSPCFVGPGITPDVIIHTMD